MQRTTFLQLPLTMSIIKNLLTTTTTTTTTTTATATKNDITLTSIDARNTHTHSTQTKQKAFRIMFLTLYVKLMMVIKLFHSHNKKYFDGKWKKHLSNIRVANAKSDERSRYISITKKNFFMNGEVGQLWVNVLSNKFNSEVFFHKKSPWASGGGQKGALSLSWPTLSGKNGMLLSPLPPWKFCHTTEKKSADPDGIAENKIS